MKEVYRIEDIEKIAEKVMVYMKEKGSHILALSGELGAGKTTLVQVLAQSFGVTSAVQSPTFAILKSYDSTHSIYTHFVHVDAYRITHEDELVPLRFSEYLTDTYFVCIEWPEHIPHILEQVPHVIARIEHKGDSREIELYEKK